MTGVEIIEVFKENVGEITTAVGAVTGSLLTAIFLRNNTSIKEFEKIKAGRFEEVIEELLSSGKMTYTEFYKAKNFLNIAKKADMYSSKKMSDKTKSYDFDWFIRYYESVGNISNSEMQEIWAKILAGETNSPHSFSLKTIDVLRNIGKDEAELFGSVCKKCFSFGNDGLSLPNYETYMEQADISYAMIMHLSELGLMYNDATIYFELPISKDNRIVLVNDGYILTAKSENENAKTLTIKQYPLTKAGRELASLISGMPNVDDLISFAKAINSGNDVKLEIHKIQSVSGNQVKFDNDDLLHNEVEN